MIASHSGMAAPMLSSQESTVDYKRRKGSPGRQTACASRRGKIYSPVSTVVANVTFQNLRMTNVSNPIIIDPLRIDPSKVKLSDIRFTGIKGTSATPEAVILKCSQGFPCKNVSLQDIQLKYINGSDAVAVCANVSPHFSGTVLPKTCTAPATKASS